MLILDRYQHPAMRKNQLFDRHVNLRPSVEIGLDDEILWMCLPSCLVIVKFQGNCVLNPNRAGGWHDMPQEIYLSLILLAIVDPDGNRTILSNTLLNADFGPVGRN